MVTALYVWHPVTLAVTKAHLLHTGTIPGGQGGFCSCSNKERMESV